MILKTTEASKYIGVSINTIKTLANNVKIKSLKTTGGHRRFMQEDLDASPEKLQKNKIRSPLFTPDVLPQNRKKISNARKIG